MELVWLFAAAAIQMALDGSERQALVDIFDAMGGKKWRNGTASGGNWLVGDPCENSWCVLVCVCIERSSQKETKKQKT